MSNQSGLFNEAFENLGGGKGYENMLLKNTFN